MRIQSKIIQKVNATAKLVPKAVKVQMVTNSGSEHFFEGKSGFRMPLTEIPSHLSKR